VQICLGFENSATVRLFIDYIYLSDYTTPCELQCKDIKPPSSWLSRRNRKIGERLSRWVPGVPPPTITKDDQLATHVRMYHMGDKYAVPTLKDAARDKFWKRVQPGNLDSEDLAAAITIAYASDRTRTTSMQHCVFECLVQGEDRAILNEHVRDAIESVENLSFKLFKRLKYGKDGE
jgi:hypothetical protein